MADKEEKSESLLKTLWSVIANLIAVIAGLLAILGSSGLAAFFAFLAGVFAFFSNHLDLAIVFFLFALLIFSMPVMRTKIYTIS